MIAQLAHTLTVMWYLGLTLVGFIILLFLAYAFITGFMAFVRFVVYGESRGGGKATPVKRSGDRWGR